MLYVSLEEFGEEGFGIDRAMVVPPRSPPLHIWISMTTGGPEWKGTTSLWRRKQSGEEAEEGVLVVTGDL